MFYCIILPMVFILYCITNQVLCSAFESGSSGGEGRLQELVLAAWGVYSTGGSEEDAVDSLGRIANLAVKPSRP